MNPATPVIKYLAILSHHKGGRLKPPNRRSFGTAAQITMTTVMMLAQELPGLNCARTVWLRGNKLVWLPQNVIEEDVPFCTNVTNVT